MPRTATVKLDNKSTRLKLTPRTKPYNRSISPRRVLGYIRAAAGAGKWLSVVQIGRNDGGAVRRQSVIGIADDYAPADGAGILSYPQAVAKAAVWNPDGPDTGEITEREVIRRYVAKRRTANSERSAKGALGNLRCNVLGELPNGKPIRDGRIAFGDRAVNAVDLTFLREWRDGLLTRMDKSAANRVLKDFKAALNFSFKDEKNGIKSDKAWRHLELFKDADRRREDHFTGAQVRRLIGAAHKAGHPEFGNFIEGAFHSGARPPEELAQLNVEHFDAAGSKLHIIDGKTGPRIMYLSPEAVAFFKKITKGRAKTEVPFPTASVEGARWRTGGTVQDLIKPLLKAAKLPTTASLYTLRHSHISRAIENKQSLLTLAGNVGTSIAQIEKNYAHVLSKVRRAEINRTAPRLAPKKGAA